MNRLIYLTKRGNERKRKILAALLIAAALLTNGLSVCAAPDTALGDSDKSAGSLESDWFISASYEQSGNCYILTEDNTTFSSGSLWSKMSYTDNFTLEMDYYTGVNDRPCGGADGITVVFFAKAPVGGAGERKFADGYGLELDTYQNYQLSDPSYNHIALVKDSSGNHLADQPLPEAEDGTWHHLKLEVADGNCTAYIDGSIRLTHSVSSTGYGWLGITASTGSGTNLHTVSNITLTGVASGILTPSSAPVEWDFLFVIYKNYIPRNAAAAVPMSQEEIDAIQYAIEGFEKYIKGCTFFSPHFETVVIDTPITVNTQWNPAEHPNELWISAEDTWSYLSDVVDLDKYDHITAFANMYPDKTYYLGLGGAFLPNGTGYSFVNTQSREYCLFFIGPKSVPNVWPPAVIVHEFLHFTESLGHEIGQKVPLTCHDATEYGYGDENDYMEFYTDLLLRRIPASDGTLMGVSELIWAAPPHLLR